MKSAAPLPPGSHKKGSKESIPNLMNGKTIVSNHDALVYVLKERSWSPVIESYAKVCLVLTEPKMYRVMVWDAQNLVHILLLTPILKFFFEVVLSDLSCYMYGC